MRMLISLLRLRGRGQTAEQAGQVPEPFGQPLIVKSLAKEAATREHCYRSLDDVRYVLIMCEARDWKAVEPCIDTLKKKGKTVHVCVFF